MGGSLELTMTTPVIPDLVGKPCRWFLDSGPDPEWQKGTSPP